MKKTNAPEVFSSIHKVFKYVKKEVIQNEENMDCMLRIFADDMKKQIQHLLLELDFHAHKEWENDEDESPVCNIALINIPFNLTYKGKECYAPLFEMLTDKKQVWQKEANVEVKWRKPYKTPKGYCYGVEIKLLNADIEIATRFVSFVAAYFLPEGDELKIRTEFLREFDGGYEWVDDFMPDEDEKIIRPNQRLSVSASGKNSIN